MDIHESKRIIQTGIAWANWDDKQKEAMRLALVSLDKQLPKKVVGTDKEGGFCPQCQAHNINLFRYCNECGQLLDWQYRTLLPHRGLQRQQR
ncbi:hypothetical protein M3202_19640 [Alkalihalobacillus oceani]|uniref:Uncharacterized protein n=1 Tax=Halalkalibacter oceani TaxID=1653776 RepID=A0A9X2DVP1_9BACI|nr:hypothetical protein [Halalkalibacter oceani]MCM3716260.1 hypothetical protein [Halalkalibacter oceani]